jgi:ABC-type dipeptide/oligopeptide/nickel transport system permease subunit
MATKEAKIKFAIRRFKGFWQQFRKSKRGLTGLLIIIFFALIAIFAPFIAPYNDPIRPMDDVGIFTKYGPSIGRPIAVSLAVPAWYKYLPFIPKGQTNKTERFYNAYITAYGQQWQLFGREGENATSTLIEVTSRIAKLNTIIVTYPNGTESAVSQNEYEFDPHNPKALRLLNLYPEGTKFDVQYVTGVDIVENIVLIRNPGFTSKDSLDEWQLYPAGSEMRFSETDGYYNDGCIEIKSLNLTQVELTKNFVYAYYEPPKKILAHFAYKLISNENATITFVLERDGSTNFTLYDFSLVPSDTYQSNVFDSLSETFKENVGSSYPLDYIFGNPSNFTLSLRVTLPSNSKLYLDNVAFIIYGNAFGILGTDNNPQLPRDIFSLLIYGSRVSLFIGVLSAIFSTLIGLFVGLVAGYVGGVVDEGLMRFADLLLVMPTLPLFIVLVVALRAVGVFMSLWNLIIIITLFGWMSFSRTVRSMVLSLRERAFVEAAKASGAGTMHIITRHILPNVFALVYITLATSVPGAIVLEASLSWLGLGDPLIPSWGKILYDFNASGLAVTKGVADYWYWLFPACIAIAVLAAAFILMGYAMDEILNPRLRERR